MHPSRKPVMAANWKMFKTTAEAAQFIETLHGLLDGVSKDDMPTAVICPPYTALSTVSQSLGQLNLSNTVFLGAQNMESKADGAFTGEISPRMLRDLNVSYVVLGHSERREYYNETDAGVNAKAKAALENNLIPIVCVGESLAQREAGQTDAWVTRQVEAALDGITPEQRKKLILAYEPIWAIGTGKVCDAAEANRVIGLIRQTVGVAETRILYGGSMKPDNVEGLMAQPEIDGGLVGGASLEPASYVQLIKAAMPLNV